eukprot:9503707-Pyramimonas_sp.AAC.1
METMATPPEQLRLVMLAMLPKPTGGLRPIGIFTSPYRLRGKCRRQEALLWEEDHKHDTFAAHGSKSASDVVWRQTARSEAAARQ